MSESVKEKYMNVLKPHIPWNRIMSQAVIAERRLAGTKKKALSECLAPPPSLGSSSTPRQYLPKLTDTKKALLDTNQGCRRCRKPFVGHTSDACPMKANNTWPDVQSYIPITSATIEAAKLPPPGMVGLAATHKNLDQDLANYFAEEDDGVPMDNDTDDD